MRLSTWLYLCDWHASRLTSSLYLAVFILTANLLSTHHSLAQSNTVSERTTKNALAQTRLMRRQVKQSNNYDSIQLKLRIED